MYRNRDKSEVSERCQVSANLGVWVHIVVFWVTTPSDEDLASSDGVLTQRVIIQIFTSVWDLRSFIYRAGNQSRWHLLNCRMRHIREGISIATGHSPVHLPHSEKPPSSLHMHVNAVLNRDNFSQYTQGTQKIPCAQPKLLDLLGTIPGLPARRDMEAQHQAHLWPDREVSMAPKYAGTTAVT